MKYIIKWFLIPSEIRYDNPCGGSVQKYETDEKSTAKEKAVIQAMAWKQKYPYLTFLAQPEFYQNDWQI